MFDFVLQSKSKKKAPQNGGAFCLLSNKSARADDKIGKLSKGHTE
jgi:hypothetical protein